MRRAIRLLALGAGLAAASACGESTGLPPSPIGSYSLRSVNDAPLPFVVSSDDAGRGEIIGGTLALNPDGTFRQTFVSRLTPPSGAASTAEGVNWEGAYAANGKSITMTLHVVPNVAPIVASYDGSTIRFTDGARGRTYVWAR